MDLLKAASARLAAAKSMSFTATASYEFPSQLGPPILYTVRYDVTMQRPDKLRVIIPGDGPASEFYYDGQSMIAYAPAENLAAVANAPPTIEAALKAAFTTADIYYPFTDLVVADPYAALTDGTILAFYIGPSGVVGGVKTEMVAWANPDVFLQIWIGADDKLPRRVRATYSADPLHLRHELDLSNWQLDADISPGYVHVGEGQDRATDEIRPARERVDAAWPEAARDHQADQGCDGPASNEVTLMRTHVMKPIVIAAGALLMGTLWNNPAGAWASANRYGGSTTHSYGETSHTNAYGGSTSHSYGEGTEHSNMYGGSSEHAYGGGTEHTNAYGGSTSGAYGQGATHTNMYGGSTSGAYGEGATHTYASGATVYHPPAYGTGGYAGYPAYHPPVAVPYYAAQGCYGCAAAAGAIVGATAGVAAGVAVAGAAAPPPAYYAPAPVAYAALPAGCAYRPFPHEYDCGGMWLAAAYGANGVYYYPVPTP